MDELEKAIEAMMENDLVQVALTDMNARLQYCNERGLRGDPEGERVTSPECIDTEVRRLLR